MRDTTIFDTAIGSISVAMFVDFKQKSFGVTEKSESAVKLCNATNHVRGVSTLRGLGERIGDE